MMRSLALIVALVFSASPADAALFRMKCELSDPGKSYVRRVPPGRYPRGYPFCTGGENGVCVFRFCPSLPFVVNCYLNPHCATPIGPCTTTGDSFNVKVRGKMRLRVGQHRVTMRCAP